MMTVNTNVASLNAQRNLVASDTGLRKAIERLSSGLRINRAADDAAGLAISEKLTSLVRGYDVAARNANDGVSLLQTGEGAMVEVTNMVQRMRDLAIQAASDTLGTQNRLDLQKEVDELLGEITRIGNTTTFNGQRLLDGTFASKSIQIGAEANQTLSISLSDLRASTLGQVAITTSSGSTAALSAGDLVINSIDVGATTSDGVSSAGANYSAIAMANAVNGKTSSTNVKANVLSNAKTATNAVTAVNVASGEVLLNGVNLGAITVQANDADSALRNAINAKSNQTGITASLATGNKLVLTASDGRNIQIAMTADHATEFGFAAADSVGTFTGKIELVSSAGFSLSGTGELKAGFADNLSVSIDSNTAINNVKITTTAEAQVAIQRLDIALEQIGTRRAQLGAYQNRLTTTIANLNTSKENLAAARSRILDADFAAETASLTKWQIIQQAGTAMLAQANTVPQGALTLLRG